MGSRAELSSVQRAKANRCVLKKSIGINHSPPTMLSAPLIQGGKAGPLLVGTLYCVPVQQVEPSCTGLMPLNPTTLCQLCYAFFWLGCPLLSMKDEGPVLQHYLFDSNGGRDSVLIVL